MVLIEFPCNKASERLDKLVTEVVQTKIECGELPEEAYASRSQVARWIEQGNVLVDGKTTAKTGTLIVQGQTISVSIPDPHPTELEPDPSIKLDIRFEDEAVLVLNKPAGLLVHPGAERSRRTLCHGILAHVGGSIRSVGHPARPGIVHRLDRDTSGLMIVAKTERSYQALVKQFLPPRTVSRRYIALTRPLPRGSALKEQGTIARPIARDETNRKRMIVDKDGREASTHYRVKERFAFGMLVELELESGRTHQIRVHLESIGIPIIGDPVYKRSMFELPAALRAAVESFGRQALHAAKLSFIHPSSGETQELEAELPEDMKLLVEQFRGKQ